MSPIYVNSCVVVQTFELCVSVLICVFVHVVECVYGHDQHEWVTEPTLSAGYKQHELVIAP